MRGCEAQRPGCGSEKSSNGDQAVDGAITLLNGTPAWEVGVLCCKSQMLGSFSTWVSECEQPEYSDFLIPSEAGWACRSQGAGWGGWRFPSPGNYHLLSPPSLTTSLLEDILGLSVPPQLVKSFRKSDLFSQEPLAVRSLGLT